MSFQMTIFFPFKFKHKNNISFVIYPYRKNNNIYDKP